MIFFLLDVEVQLVGDLKDYPTILFDEEINLEEKCMLSYILVGSECYHKH